MNKLFVLLFAAVSLLNATGQNAPDFTLKDLTGKKYTLSKLWSEKPVVMDFWAIWCHSCGRALKELEELWNEAGDSSFYLISIDVDNPSKISRVRSLVKSRGWKFPVLLDSQQKVKLMYKVMALPTLFVIDTTGRIVYFRVGYKPNEKEDVKKVLLNHGVKFKGGKK